MSELLLGQRSADGLDRGLDVRVVRGRSAVFSLLPEFDALAVQTGLPVTARAAWIRALLVADPLAHPWAVVVRGAEKRLRAAAILFEDDGQARLAGGGGGYRAGVPASDGEAMAVLGEGLRHEADAHGATLCLATLPDTHETNELAQAAGGSLEPEPSIPGVDVRSGGEILDRLSHGVARTLRKARNRLTADGRAAVVTVTSQPADVGAALPAMEQAYRSRDREHGLPCPLDTPLGLARWRERIRQLLEERCLELATLTIDGRLAAYVLGVRDGSRYGVLEGHFDTAWARYSPGRLVEASVLRRALADPGVDCFDWMTSVAPESLLTAGTSESVVTVRRQAAVATPMSGA